MSRNAIVKKSKKLIGTSRSIVKRRVTPSDNFFGGAVVPFVEGSPVTDLISGPVYQQYRGGEYVHVSDLLYSCMRKVALSDKLKTPIHSRPIYDSQGITFAQGEAIHSYIVGKAVRQDPSIVYGNWTCNCGKHVITGTKVKADREGTCGACNSPIHRYREIVVTNETYKVSGSIDLVLVPNGAIYPVELKSIKKDSWEELARPVPEHLSQVLMYWFLLREAGYNVHDKASIVYAVKEMVMKNPFKEFVIRPSELMDRIQVYLDLARELVLYREIGQLPNRIGGCYAPDSKDAKACQFCTICFQL